MICVEAIKACIRIRWTSSYFGMHDLLAADRFGRAHRTGRQGQEAHIRVGRFPFVGNGKELRSSAEDQGLVKVIFYKNTVSSLAPHMVGAEVTELIQGYVIAMNRKPPRS